MRAEKYTNGSMHEGIGGEAEHAVGRSQKGAERCLFTFSPCVMCCGMGVQGVPPGDGGQAQGPAPLRLPPGMFTQPLRPHTLGPMPTQPCSFPQLILCPHSPYAHTKLVLCPHSPHALTQLVPCPHSPYALTHLVPCPHTPYALTQLLLCPHSPYARTHLLLCPHSPAPEQYNCSSAVPSPSATAPPLPQPRGIA
jgi:hypothetical protein